MSSLMNAVDADCIVKLRTSGKSWQSISLTMGWCIRACQNAYKDRTNGKIYSEEWLKYISKEDFKNNSIATVYNKLVQSFNYPYSLSAFTVICYKYKLISKTERVNKNLDNIFDSLITNGSSFEEAFVKVYQNHYKHKNSYIRKHSQVIQKYARTC